MADRPRWRSWSAATWAWRSTRQLALDCAAAVENLLLAAHALGLGGVWTGVYPDQGRMEGLGRLLGLPKHIMAHTLVVLGYPAEQPTTENRYEAGRVHVNGW